MTMTCPACWTGWSGGPFAPSRLASTTVTVALGPDRLETVAGAEIAAVAHTPDEPKPWHGPIVEAVRYREPRRVEDAETEQRWPGFGERMRIAGFRGCLGLPLPAFRRPSVGCSRFSSRPNQFTEHVMDLVMLFALHAGTTFDNAALYDHSRQLVDHLHAALANRDMVGQAKGLLMQRFGVIQMPLSTCCGARRSTTTSRSGI
ncbi:MAG TPA: GAF and ANTAR domain-containing protein [Mycobacterium sp.]|nr:GAF and ANTAR domain-containing protein [Mycobacterium sp.]